MKIVPATVRVWVVAFQDSSPFAFLQV